ncbi:hypothetical protein [Salinispira pacifica]
MDEWYKDFGHRPIVRYYKLLRLDGEKSVEIEQFTFDRLRRRITSTEVRTIPFKAWVDAIAANSVHEIPEAEVPFLFHF